MTLTPLQRNARRRAGGPPESLWSARWLRLLLIGAPVAFHSALAAAQPPTVPASAAPPDDGQWTMPAKNYAATRYSALDEINGEDVKNLQVAFAFSTGVDHGQEAAPIVANNTMYIVTPYPNILFALDLTKPGAPIKWSYQPHPAAAAQGVACCDVVNRGAVYSDGKVFFNTLDDTTIALDAQTGALLWQTKLGDINTGETITMAPLVVKGKVLVGDSGGELGVRGWLTALDVNTGKIVWRAYATGPDKDVLIGPGFHSFYPSDNGADLGIKTWPTDAWQTGGGTMWGWIAYDPDLNLIYYGTGNPGPWNQEQRPGDNKWTTTLFARDPDTGAAKWALQYNPHDEHDYDGINEQILVDMDVNGKPRKVLLHPDRNGHLYVVDRETGEIVSAQPYGYVNSVLRIDLETGRPVMNPDKLTKLDTVVHDICPTASGLKDWNPSAYSPSTGLMYIPHENLCMDWKSREVNYIAGTPFVGAEVITKAGHGGNRGEFTAWDPVQGKAIWTIKEDLPLWSGALATAGGLVFYGTMDGWFKAVDAKTGALKWQFMTGSGIIGQPVAYRGPDGHEYVAILSGVGGWAGAIVSGNLDPGIGKTALALHVARALLPNFEGQAALAELAALSDPDLVPSTVATSLRMNLGSGEISAESVARAINGKRLLLVLDNCEHVIGAAAELAETIQRLCPHATILATSRDVLRTAGEYVYRVPPLNLPPTQNGEPDEILRHGAVQLFIARVGALRSDLMLHGENLQILAAICRRLDGIPLAIEFAAARAATLGLQEVASRLDDRFALLTGGRRTALPRQQTLRATLDWSYDLLAEPERRMLRRLGVFVAGFTIEAAAAVASDPHQPAAAAAERIADLVAKSLVIFEASGPVDRWRLLETIRVYALRKLAENGETEPANRRHAEYFRSLFGSASRDQQAGLPVLDTAQYSRELGNVRAALDWAFSPVGDKALGVVLTAAYVPGWLPVGDRNTALGAPLTAGYVPWQMRTALMVECRERTAQALANLGADLHLDAPLLVRLHFAFGGTAAVTLGSAPQARAALNTALRVAGGADDQTSMLRVLWILSVLYNNIGECRNAQTTLEQYFAIANHADERIAALVGERLAGYTLQLQGKLREAQTHFECLIENYVPPSDRRYMVWPFVNQRVLARALLARGLWLQGDAEQAVYQGQASLDEAQLEDDQQPSCEALRLAVCPIAIMTGDLVAAERAVAELIDIATRCNANLWMIQGRCLQGKLLIAQGEFGSGVSLLRGELDTCERSGWAIWLPEFLGSLAEGLAGLGQFAEALATVEQALARAERGGECYYSPELLRIKGELLLRTSGGMDVLTAEHCFVAALGLARQQGALFWELRVAMSLARLRAGQEQPDEARRILLATFSRFSDGFETSDLRSARTMLETLPPA